MSRVKTNDMTLQAVVETSLEVAGTTGWFLLQFDQLSDYGTDIKTVTRDPISKNRQLEQGTTVDLDSKVTLTTDWTYTHAYRILPQFVMSKWVGSQVFTPTAVTATGYTVSGASILPAGSLVYARGFSTAANNGLKKTNVISTAIEIKAAGLTAEAAPPSNVFLEVCGVEGAAGDITIDANGNITSTTLDFTAQPFNLQTGQALYIGDPLTAGCAFATAADAGYVRVKSVTAHLITVDKRGGTFAADTGAGKTIRLFFGQFLRNVATDHADFVEQSWTFELSYPGLDTGSATMYEYSGGNYANELTINLPLASKATMQAAWIGVDTPAPVSVGSRKTGASTAVQPVTRQALNTSAEIGRLRVQKMDETGITSYFKNCTLKLMNNVSGEKALANLGPVLMNYGDFEVEIDTSIMLTDAAVISMIRSNTAVTMDFTVANPDGGYLIDIPRMTIGSGKREFPKNASVLLKGSCKSVRDTTLDTSIGITRFPYLPIDFTTI